MYNEVTESELLTVDEAARFLHLRSSTVRDWIYKKRIAYVKFSRRVFLRRADLKALIEKSVVPASRSQVKVENVA